MSCPHKNVRAGVCMGCDERLAWASAHTNLGRGCEPEAPTNLRQWLADYERELDQVGDAESPLMSELARRIAPTIRILRGHAAGLAMILRVERPGNVG